MKLNNKLSFTLGIRSLVILLSLGFVMALLQSIFDFHDRKAELTRAIDAVVISATGSANNATYLLDPKLAEQVINNLSYFDYFSSIVLFDEYGKKIASYSRQATLNELDMENASYLPILTWLLDNFTTQTILLSHDNAPSNEQTVNGKMIITVNNHVAYTGVFYRSVRTFIIAFGGYFLLTLTLSLLYHYTLASPLIKLSNRLQLINTKSIATQKISHLVGNEHNEFSLIVNATNDLIERIFSGQVLLTERNQRFSLILDTAPALIFLLDNQLNFVFANKATATFFGYSIFNLKGRSANEVIEAVDANMMKAVNDFLSSSKRQYNKMLRVNNANNTDCHMEMLFVKFKTPDGHSILVTAADITKRVNAEEKIETLAYFDPLTSLANRNKVYEVLDQSQIDGTGMYGMVAIADLDQFKRINDSLSHSVGDQLIVQLASRLREEFSTVDLIARTGVDEFLCIQKNVSKDIETAKNCAEALGERLRGSINKEIDIGLHSYSLSASVGVIVFLNNQLSSDEILQYADTAMHESKRSGRNCVTLFRDEMATQASQSLELERDIMKAIVMDEFFFVLQPLIDSSTHLMVGAEALMRWQKGNEVILPDKFIPFLEESALIIDVGERILNKVCAYIADIKTRGIMPKDFKISVNISAKQLAKKDFIEMVSKVLRKHGVLASSIEIEITESVALNNMADTIQKINQMKKMGITFSLDDFGTGYSSLSHLKDLPVDKLKIDRSFINDLTVDKLDGNLVRSIIQLSKNLGLVTVAEGVETQEQVEWLMLTGDILLQGYYFNEPTEPAEFEKAYL